MNEPTHQPANHNSATRDPATRIDIHDIRKILPHRYPFLLIDRVLEYQLHTSLTAIKNISMNEPFFQGHFPARPVFPGVLIIEAIAQASAILASRGLNQTQEPDENIIFLFAGIDKARFKRPVEPGDQLLIEVTQTNCKNRVWKCSGRASVDGNMCALADILFTYRQV